MESVRVAIVQSAPRLFDRATSFERMRERVAKCNDADLIVFPEAYVGGYPKGADFGAVVGMRRPAGRDLFARYHDAAIDVPGPDCEAMGELAREANANLVVGVIERDGGTLYCSVVFFDRDGRLVDKHRKLVPTAQERVIWGRGDGSTLAAPRLDVGTVGAVICWENYMPLLRSAMYAKGVQIYCAPTVDDRDSWIPTMRHIAVEGRCFVLSACQHATRADFPEDWPTDFGDDPETRLIRGGSCVIDPFGEVLAGPVYGEDTIVRAELDLGRRAAAQYDLDVNGHYARPDVFQLHVDERVRSSIVTKID